MPEPGRLLCREQPALAADATCELRGIAGTLHLNAGNRTLDLSKIASGQLHSSRAEVLLQPMQLGGSWDGDDPWLLRKQPGESNLRIGYAFLCSDLAEHIYERLVIPYSIFIANSFCEIETASCPVFWFRTLTVRKRSTIQSMPAKINLAN